MTIGEKIKCRRTQVGISVEDLARRIGKSRATVYRYENGRILDLPSSVLIPIAKALSTTPAELMCCDEQNSEAEIATDPSEAKSPEIDEINRILLSLPCEAVEKLLDYARMLKAFYR